MVGDIMVTEEKIENGQEHEENETLKDEGKYGSWWLLMDLSESRWILIDSSGF
jgi:hypothetical protein